MTDRIEIVLSTGEHMAFRNGICVSEEVVSWWKLTDSDMTAMGNAAKASRDLAEFIEKLRAV